MKKICCIFGTRPEAIKMAPVVKVLQARADVDCKVCVTAQHREMLDQVLQVFGIVPDEDLNIMKPNQSLGELTSRLIDKLDRYLAVENPDVVLVQGDTTTVLAGALAAFYHKIPVGHVEAGLRTGNLYSPWPEEANRLMTTRLAKWHFCPTETSKANLLREGVPSENIYVTGNTVIDALHLAQEIVRENPPRIEGLDGEEKVGGENRWTAEESSPYLTRTDFASTGSARRMVLITGHRRENFGEGFEQICHAIAQCAKEFPDVDFVYPVHLNPNVREPVRRILGCESGALIELALPDGSDAAGVRALPDGSGALIERALPGNSGAAGVDSCASASEGRRTTGNVHLIKPLGYLEFVALMTRATFVLTDSGGVQEEAPSIGKPVLVMRDTTERPEAVTAGGVRLVGANAEKIYAGVRELLTNEDVFSAMAKSRSPYGDGHAAERIVEIVLK